MIKFFIFNNARMKNLISVCTFLFLFIFFSPTVSFSSDNVSDAQGDHSKIKLISNVSSVTLGSSFDIAIHFKIEKGWHIYWSNPGEVGFPTTIVVNTSPSFKVQYLPFPSPEVLVVNGIRCYVYSDDVYFFISIETSSETYTTEINDIEIHVQLDWAECSDICILNKKELSLRIPISQIENVDSLYADLFEKQKDHIPSLLEKNNIELNLKNNHLSIVLSTDDFYDISDIQFFPNVNSNIFDFFNQSYHAEDTKLHIPFLSMESANHISTEKIQEMQLDGILSIQTDISKKDYVFKSSIQLSHVQDAMQNILWFNILLSILGAFLGGVLLNFMPCVFPILSIKIFSFIQQGLNRKLIWKYGLAYSSGIISSFLVLGLLLQFLRFQGLALGWGFQLQYPPVIVVLVSVFFLFGLSLFDVFTIDISSFLSRNTDVKVGNGLKLSKAFLGGLFCTILASPCSAPFIGVSLGFALTQGMFIGFLIFMFLGIGMSFPYLLISIYPNVLHIFPKPGRWMETLKHFMGFLILGSVLWLLFILCTQVGFEKIFILLILLFVLSFLAWCLGRFGSNLLYGLKFRKIVVCITIFLIIFSIYAVIKRDFSKNLNFMAGSIVQKINLKSDTIVWTDYSNELLYELREKGIPFFINFTAEWCLTCKVNEKITFSNFYIVKRFADMGVVMIKADLTTPNKNITLGMEQYGRYGVPLYVLEHGSHDNRKVSLLPELLTKKIIFDFLDKIKS